MSFGFTLRRALISESACFADGSRGATADGAAGDGGVGGGGGEARHFSRSCADTSAVRTPQMKSKQLLTNSSKDIE